MDPRTVVQQLIDRAKSMAGSASFALQSRAGVAGARLQELLTVGAEIAIRDAAGEDTALAKAALESSITSLAREQQAMIVEQAKSLALTAAIDTIRFLGAAAAAAAG